MVEYMYANHLSLNETAVLFGIPHKITLSKWERIYYEEGREALFVEKRGRNNMTDKDNPKKPKLDKISFPEHEYESVQKCLDELGYCYTTRVYKEAGKYKVGELYKSPWGDVLKIDEVKKYWKVSERPFYDEIADDEKNLIRKYSEDMGLPYEWIKFSKQTV